MVNVRTLLLSWARGKERRSKERLCGWVHLIRSPISLYFTFEAGARGGHAPLSTRGNEAHLLGKGKCRSKELDESERKGALGSKKCVKKSLPQRKGKVIFKSDKKRDKAWSFQDFQPLQARV